MNKSNTGKKGGRLVALYIYKWREEPNEPIVLCSKADLSMLWFYQRGVAKDIINFNSRVIAGKIPPGNRASVALEDNMGMCYAWTTNEGLTATACCDTEYPEKAAMTLITKLLLAFKEKVDVHKLLETTTKDVQTPFPEMEKMLAEW